MFHGVCNRSKWDGVREGLPRQREALPAQSQGSVLAVGAASPARAGSSSHPPHFVLGNQRVGRGCVWGQRLGEGLLLASGCLPALPHLAPCPLRAHFHPS